MEGAATAAHQEKRKAALAASGGAMAAAAASLGLSSRFALYRLMKRYGMNEGEP